MTSFLIPESLKSYFGTSEKNPIKSAVDELVDRLDGEDMPELDWEEAQQYNKALLMAAQIRADYVDMLFRIWDETFGKCKIKGAKDNKYFASDGQSPSEIWEDECIFATIYRNGEPDDEGKNDDLFVTLKNKKIELHVYRIDDDGDYIELKKLPTIAGWEAKLDDDGDAGYFSETPVSIRDFIKSPDDVICDLREKAKAMTKALKE